MATSNEAKKRRQERTKAVLPVKVRGKDVAGESFELIAHTLDVTPAGVRLGAVRRELHMLDALTVFYRQRKLEFRVIWTKKMKGTSEYQVGLQATMHEREAWWLNSSESKLRETVQPVAPALAPSLA
jgi:hypothetical protein